MRSKSAGASRHGPLGRGSGRFDPDRSGARLWPAWRRGLAAERFAEWRMEAERLLAGPKGSDAQLDAELRERGLSLRVVANTKSG